MAKKEAKKTIWEEIKQVWVEQVKQFLSGWKPLWEEYKTVIGPFIKGTFAYVWKIVSGLISGVSVGLYNTGKVILEHIMEWLKRA